MNSWTTIPKMQTIDKTIAALKESGIEALVVENGEEAKTKVFEILPEGAEVMNMTSATLDAIGVTKEILESGKYKSVRKKLEKMNDEKSASAKATADKEKRHLGAAPDWAIGSVHAVTENGEVLIASNTGSQLPAYAYGASHVIWVVGVQKIVKDFNEGLKRIYEHTLPLEAERARKAYGVKRSNVSKILVVNKEIKPGRITLIIIKEVLGF